MLISVAVVLISLGATPSTATSPATSNPPATTTTITSPPQGRAPKRDAQEGKSQQQEAKPSPVVINQYLSGTSRQAASNRYAKYSKNDFVADAFIAIFTGALVVVGIFIGKYQLRLMRDTMEETRKAATAAADSNTKLERPWVMVFVEKDNVREQFFGSPPAPRFPFTIKLTWCTANYGRSPAWIVGGCVNCGVIHRALQKGEPPYGNREQPPKMPLPPDGQRAHCLEMASAPIGVDDYAAVLENRASLLFFGVVEYEDVFGIVHETRFSWGWWGSGIPNDLTFGVDGPKDWTRYS